jgi:mRNA interferase MazF
MTLSEKFDVILVPFPFTDGPNTKKRPAVVLSNKKSNGQLGHTTCAMITSQKNAAWPLDVAIDDLSAGGLPAPSVIRMKIFTIDNRLVLRSIGHLSKSDQKALSKSLEELWS